MAARTPLPEELLQGIVRHLSDLETLHSLCLTSKRMYRVTVPYLYKEFSHRMFTKPHQLHSFLRAIIAKPELARQTESIVLRDPGETENFWDLESWSRWSSSHYKPLLHADDHDDFLEAARLLHEEDVDKRKELLEREEAHAALLIVLTPNLRKFLIENPATENDQPRFEANHLLMQMMHPLIKQGVILQNLTTLVAVTSKLEGGQGGFRLSAISPFFRLPKLEYVRAVMCEEPEDAVFVGFECPERSSSVKQLTFHSSALCPAALRLLLGACKAIEVFECDWAGTVVGFVEVNFEQLRRALAGHKNSLRKLYLDTRKHFDSWPESEEGLIPPLGSLTDFTVLTELDVPASALIGWDEDNVGGFGTLEELLPPNLEILRINYAAPRMYEHITALAKVCSAKYPKLRKLTIVGEDDDNDTMLNDLKKAFEETGSEVEVLMEEDGELDHFS